MSLATRPSPSSADSSAGPCRVIVVDDSAVIRGLLTRWLEEDSDIRVVTTAANGVAAIRAVSQHPCDVVVLDIEMPEMDGITALPKIIETRPGVQVMMASTLTSRNADISLHALSLGAADYIPKPQSTRMVSAGVDFRMELIGKVKALAAQARKAFAVGAAPAPAEAPKVSRTTPTAAAVARPAPRPIALQSASKARPDILAIGSSTGGPQALFKLLGALPNAIRVPIVITQHMPPTFTAILAQHIERLTGFPAKEAEDGDLLKPGHVYVAPGDHHMILAPAAGGAKVVINQDPPENFCRPAVDPLFRSVATLYGARALCVVLTGMGQDGMRGGKDVVAQGGTILAQDEATSVVWGMPGAVANAGLAARILPLGDIAPAIMDFVQGASK
jgi:two-component system, chemotaxis family, protein-glutamate methylesterase/glutaminase